MPMTNEHEPITRRLDAMSYLGERTGTLEYRFLRYAAVADLLFANGMSDSSILADLGAGGCDFDFYLRTVRGWKGRYLPVDSSIDGTDLETWEPKIGFDFVVAIELIEHLEDPAYFLSKVSHRAGCLVITTPNTDVLGDAYVRKIDRTHVRPVYSNDLVEWGARTIEVQSFFGRPKDSLIAVWNGIR